MHIFRIPGQFRPSNSVLGLIIIHLVRDQLRAGSLYVVAASISVLVAVLVCLITWSLLTDSAESVLSEFFNLKTLLGALVFLVIFVGVGFKRGYSVTWSGQDLRIRSGRSEQEFPIRSIHLATRISSLD